MANEQVPDMPAAASRGRRLLRLFLMIAGGLAAPCLALAAFFLTSSGDDPPSRPTAAQSGVISGPATTRPTAPAATATTTTSTTAPAHTPPAGPLRDPFAPLVTQAPPAGTPPR